MSNLLPLESFRQILTYNPYHFYGLANDLAPVTSSCNTLVNQHAWQQADQAGRGEMREAIENAEERILSYLGYSVAPRYVEYTLPYALYFDERIWRISPMDSRGEWISIKFPEGYVQAVGIEQRTLVDTAPAVYNAVPPDIPFTDPTPAPPYLIFLDANGDGLVDTFEIAVDTTATDASTLAVYFSASDRLDGAPLSEDWRILPVHASIAAGVAKIRGPSWLLVKPILYEKYTQSVLDPNDFTVYVTSLVVYTRTTKTNGQTVTDSQGEFIWNTMPYPYWATCCNNTQNPSIGDPAAEAFAIARVGIRNKDLGLLIPGQAVFNTTTQTWCSVVPYWTGCRPPDKVKLRAYAGYPLDANGQMDIRLQRAVAYLAMADMPERICACDVANRVLWRWQAEMNRVATQGTEQFAITRRDLDNPFGMRRGHIFAWREILKLRLVTGVNI